MALCHPSIQRDNGKLTVLDAENAWFISVDSINDYGDDPFLEKITIKPRKPLLFLNIKSNPDCTALIWDHIEDTPGKRCPNPRVILPRDIVPGIINKPVTVDVRSFGVRTPPCSKENPSYGIIGLFHILPPHLHGYGGLFRQEGMPTRVLLEVREWNQKELVLTGLLRPAKWLPMPICCLNRLFKPQG